MYPTLRIHNQDRAFPAPEGRKTLAHARAVGFEQEKLSASEGRKKRGPEVCCDHVGAIWESDTSYAPPGLIGRFYHFPTARAVG
jgi:hypothetical protein